MCLHIFRLKCNIVLFMAILQVLLLSVIYPHFLLETNQIRRVILDLSFPLGQSVNNRVPKDKYVGSYFELKYPSIDDIVASLKQLGCDALLYKIDISLAFRHIRIDPGDIDLLGLKHDGYYFDGALPFGFWHGSVFFQRCTNIILMLYSTS